MKTAVVVARGTGGHQQGWGGAFAEGLRRHGWRVSVQGHPALCDLLCLWGVRNQLSINAQKRAGGEVAILERGYLLDRFAWTSVSFGGGLNARGVFRGHFRDGSRWERHHAHLMQPWRRRDGYALLIGQVPGDMSIAGVDINAWYRRTASELKGVGWDVLFRPHPVALQRGYRSGGPGVPTLGGDLAGALDGAGVVVTFSSNTGVDAVLAGVPTITADHGAMAWPVTSHSVGDPIVTPDRTAWGHALAWKQFTREEFASGFCWEAVGQSGCGSLTTPTAPDPVLAG